MQLTSVKKEDQEKILKTYVESFERFQAVIFCINCGSTNIDHNSVFHIECYDCRNKGMWSGQRFGLARKGDTHDVISAITPPADPFYFTGWQSQIFLSLEEFYLAFNEISVINNDLLKKEDHKKLLEEWKTLQSRMELFLRQIKIWPNEIKEEN